MEVEFESCLREEGAGPKACSLPAEAGPIACSLEAQLPHRRKESCKMEVAHLVEKMSDQWEEDTKDR